MAGSPLFLKGKFGVGYHVVLTKTEACDVNLVSQLTGGGRTVAMVTFHFHM